MVRMRVDVWASSPSHRRRRLKGRLVFLVCHYCVDVRRGGAGWREHREGCVRHLNANDQKVDRTNVCRCNLVRRLGCGISGLNGNGESCRANPRLEWTDGARECNRRRRNREACCLLCAYAGKGKIGAGRVGLRRAWACLRCMRGKPVAETMERWSTRAVRSRGSARGKSVHHG